MILILTTITLIVLILVFVLAKKYGYLDIIQCLLLFVIILGIFRPYIN